MTSLYKRILDLKIQKGYTWESLAKEAHIRISSWMTGIDAFSPSDKEIKKLADVFGVSFDYLKYGKKDE